MDALSVTHIYSCFADPGKRGCRNFLAEVPFAMTNLMAPDAIISTFPQIKALARPVRKSATLL